MLNFFGILVAGISFFYENSASAFTLAGSDPYMKGWDRRELVFNVNDTNCPVSSSVLNAAIDEAMDIWNQVPTSYIKLRRGSSSTSTAAQAWALTNSDLPIIVCDTAFSTTTSQSKDAVLGLARNGFVNGRISVSNIVLNAESSGTANIGAVSSTQLVITLAHELGHSLGIGHSNMPGALMYYSIGNKNVLALAQDDVDALTFLYSRDELGDDKFFGCGRIEDVSGQGGGPGSGAWQFLGILMVAWVATRKGRKMPTLST